MSYPKWVQRDLFIGAVLCQNEAEEIQLLADYAAEAKRQAAEAKAIAEAEQAMREAEVLAHAEVIKGKKGAK